MASTVESADATGSQNDFDWFMREDPDIKPVMRELLERYSGINPDNIVPHVSSIRSKAWAVHPYPCIGSYRFLDLGISTLPQYQDVLHRIQNQNNTLLDLGCCFGQDLRKLTFDGAPSKNLIGSDLKDDFTELGYQLFNDKESFKAKFLNGNVFGVGDDDPLSTLEGSLDIVHAGSFFHLFLLDDQVKIAKKIVKLLKPEPGSMVLGRQTGVKKARVVQRANGAWRFGHDPTSWDQMWQEVGKQTGSKWKTDVRVLDIGQILSLPANAPDREDTTWMLFACWRE